MMEIPFSHLHTSLLLHICVLACTEHNPPGKCYDLSMDMSPEFGQILGDGKKNVIFSKGC